jgi:chitodextrinase
MPRAARRRSVSELGLGLVALASLVLVLLGGASGQDRAAAAGCTVSPLLVNSCRPWFGFVANGYPAPAGSDKLSQQKYGEQRAQRQVDIAHTYHSAGDNSLSATDLYYANRPDTLLFTNWQPTKTWALADGTDPTVNSGIDQMAASVKALGDHRIFLTVFHEPENDLTALPAACPSSTPLKGTSGTAEQYRTMWATVRARFDAAGVHNVVWVMNYMNYTPFNCMVDAVYPGDDLVDWIVWNGYQHNDTDVSFPNRVSNLYSLLTATSSPAHDYAAKQWGIVEWGINLSTQANASAFYASAQQTVEANTFPKLKMFLNFDSPDYATSDGSYRVGYDASGAADPAEQQAFNAFANSPALTGSWTFADVVPPSAPGDVAAALVDGAPTISWSAAGDDVGVGSYQVSRDGTVVGTTSDLTWTDPAAPQGRSLGYTVVAVDTSGNPGPAAGPVTITVPDTTPPAAPGALTGTATNGAAVLSWTAPADNVGVTSYAVVRDGVQTATTTSTSWTDPASAAGTTATYAVRAIDAAGNTSEPSATVTVSVPADVDTVAPTAPTGVTARLSGGRPVISWRAASDNVGVTSYDVLRGGLVVGSATGLSYTDATAPQGRSSSYTVRARDARGNTGPASKAVTLAVPDSTAPTPPTGLTATRARTSVKLAWKAATDNVAVTRYLVYRGTTRVASVAASTTTVTVSGLTSGARYTFTVAAVDAAGNVGSAAAVTA